MGQAELELTSEDKKFAAQLIKMAKELEAEGFPLSIETKSGRKINKELVSRLIKARKELGNERSHKLKNAHKTQDDIFKKMLKKLLSSPKKEKKQEKKDNSYGIGSEDFLEKELARTIIRLRSDSTIDSDANDLRLLEDMAKVIMLSSTLSGKSKGVFFGKQAVNNISTTTGGAQLTIAVDRQAFGTNMESMSDSLRQRLDKQTASVDISALPVNENSQERKLEDLRNRKFVASAEALRKKDGNF